MNITQSSQLPFLEFLGWQIADVYRLTQLEMLASYERGWRYRHITNLPASELAFIKQLAFDRKSWLSSEFMDFKSGHHQLIHRVLEGLNCEFLSECRAYFGGGTLISLDIGEYRTSNDIDFICALGADYRKLRNAISDSPGERLCQQNPHILLKDNSGLEIERFTADQYGIRMAIVVDGIPIKTEIIADLRFHCYENLTISEAFRSKLIDGIDLLAIDLGLDKTIRTIGESGDEIFPFM